MTNRISLGLSKLSKSLGITAEAGPMDRKRTPEELLHLRRGEMSHGMGTWNKIGKSANERQNDKLNRAGSEVAGITAHREGQINQTAAYNNQQAFLNLFQVSSNHSATLLLTDIRLFH
ncbi:unnamed protein product [Caenorhabditis auriculariae]|uniref:Uncharacterized protein n=1 Tax=Caenorhabditis auriculariae TaxID=2777116 RepID=A0A8S1HA88_9PELO|nr:unnamed protein product [Caenorhabditis auriculariae]